MDTIAQVIITIILLIPVYGLLLWGYIQPEESMLFGKRWMYKEDPEPSIKAIRYVKFSTMTAMIGIPIILVSSFMNNHLFRLTPLVFLVVLLFGVFRIFTAEEES
jgi:hypothetical protein